MKLFLVIALFCGSVMADGDQPNGGRTDCTVNCPPPCTENCGLANGTETESDPIEGWDFEMIPNDLIIGFANEAYRLFI